MELVVVHYYTKLVRYNNCLELSKISPSFFSLFYDKNLKIDRFRVEEKRERNGLTFSMEENTTGRMDLERSARVCSSLFIRRGDPRVVRGEGRIVMRGQKSRST